MQPCEAELLVKAKAIAADYKAQRLGLHAAR